MAAPLAHEPSVHAILANVLPPGSRVVAGADALRRRVSWPVLARTTGLGEIEGGELILVPSGRSSEVLARLAQLAEVGIAALVIGGSSEEVDWPSSVTTDIPVVFLPVGVNLRRLQGDIERYIARRRRDLFALDHELHHALVDAAIAGTSVAELLRVAGRRAAKPVAVDRDGDLLTIPGTEAVFAPGVLLQARIKGHASATGAFEIPGNPPALAIPVVAGRERRGIALLLGSESPFTDEDEALLSSLASACAISLSREPLSILPKLPQLLDEIEAKRSSRDSMWTALAVNDPSSTPRQLERAILSEFAARDASALLAVEGAGVVAMVVANSGFPWSVIARSIMARLGSEDVRLTIGRPHPGPRGARSASIEALEAVAHARPGELTTFASIELQALLSSSPRWREFARFRVGALLSNREDDRELVQTLQTYLQQGRNARAAADALKVHRNTLLYRLRRIEQRLNVQLDDAQTLFEFDLATRVLALDPELASENDGSD